MGDRNPSASHADHSRCRAAGQAGCHTRQLRHGIAKLPVDRIRAFDRAIVHLIGVGAAATGRIVIRAAQFGFDIAAQQGMRGDALLDVGKDRRVHIKPVHVAVEYHPRSGLGGQAPFQRGHGLAVAIQPTDHIQRLAVEQRLIAEAVSRQLIIQRATTTGGHAATRERERCSHPGSRYSAVHSSRP